MANTYSPRRPDKWTIMFVLGTGITSLVSDAYWLGEACDIFSGAEPKAINLSYFGIGFGLTSGILVTLGALFSDYILNIRHQDMDFSNEESQHFFTPNLRSVPMLRWWQQLALLAKLVSYTGDIAGPITFVINLATNNRLNRLSRGLIFCGSSIFGGFTSIASVRTCRNNMLAHNAEKQKRPSFTLVL